jgi:DNA-binding transcriptional regulator PaaX
MTLGPGNPYDPPCEEREAQARAHQKLDSQDCSMQCLMLVYACCSPPYVDPNLPLELLLDNRLGDRAAHVFQRCHDLLSEDA